MTFNTTKCKSIILVISSALLSEASIAAPYIPAKNTSTASSNVTSIFAPLSSKQRQGHAVIQLGGFWANQGEAQDINIQGLVSNHYSVDNQNDGNVLVGVGYYLNGLSHDRFQLAYGLNAFYLGATSVSGDVIQEHLYSNLSYHYDNQNTPIYLDAKAIINSNSEEYNLTLDAGIGPNFMRTSHYYETPNAYYTIPDNAFTSNTSVTFSATAGVGLRLNKIIGKTPLECGYRFFYLGKGQLAKNSDQLINTISTGNTYNNALLCSITI